MKYFVLLYCFLGLSKYSLTQNLLNGDLEGVVTDVSQLPVYWLPIEFSDPVCYAIDSDAATADLTGINGPVVSYGIFGYPYSGNTFVSGSYSSGYVTPDSLRVYHEGIKQEIELEAGCLYKLSFYQSVVKQYGGVIGGNVVGDFDSTGMWMVYANSDLIGISSVSLGLQPYDSPNLTWDYREMGFIALKNQNTIKFLPFDDDENQLLENSGGVRMGIDNIVLEPTNICYSAIEMPNVFSPNGDGVNDVFSPVSIYGIGEYHFTIVNRWGNTVFESNDPTVFWDGGKAKEGTYFWKVNYSDLEGRKLEQQGFLTLIR